MVVIKQDAQLALNLFFGYFCKIDFPEFQVIFIVTMLYCVSKYFSSFIICFSNLRLHMMVTTDGNQTVVFIDKAFHISSV